jgi:hypothetical protein
MKRWPVLPSRHASVDCTFYCRLAGSAMACVVALAAASVEAEGLAWRDGRLAAAQAHDRELIAAATHSPPQPLFEDADEIVAAPNAGHGTQLGPDATDMWESPASTGGPVPGSLQLDRDCASLRMEGVSPTAALMARQQASAPIGAPAAGSADSASSPKVAAAPGTAGPVARSAESAIWAIGAIVACGLGVAGLRGPFWATRYTPVRRGLKP